MSIGVLLAAASAHSIVRAHSLWLAGPNGIPVSNGSIIPGCRATRSTRWLVSVGGMVTIVLKGGLDERRRFLDHGHVFALTESPV